MVVICKPILRLHIICSKNHLQTFLKSYFVATSFVLSGRTARRDILSNVIEKELLWKRLSECLLNAKPMMLLLVLIQSEHILRCWVKSCSNFPVKLNEGTLMPSLVVSVLITFGRFVSCWIKRTCGVQTVTKKRLRIAWTLLIRWTQTVLSIRHHTYNVIQNWSH